MRLPVYLLVVLVASVLTVHAAHPVLHALAAPQALAVTSGQRLLHHAAVSLQGGDDDIFDSCMSVLKGLGDFNVEKMLMSAGVSDSCRLALNTSTPPAIIQAQNTLRQARQESETDDCKNPVKTNTSDISSCTTTYTYSQPAKSAFKSAIEGSTPAGRMVQQDMSTSFKMSMSASFLGQSMSMYMSKSTTEKGEITAFPAVCTNADLGKLTVAVATLGAQMAAALQSLGTCVAQAAQKSGISASVSASGGMSMTLYPDFDTSMNAVQGSRITASFYNAALPTCAAGSMLVTAMLAVAAAMLARKLF